MKFPTILCGEQYCDPESAIYSAAIGQKVLKTFCDVPVQNPMLKRQYVHILKEAFSPAPCRPAAKKWNCTPVLNLPFPV